MKFWLVLLLIPFVSGCGVNWGLSDVGNMLVVDTVERMRDTNKRKIARLTVEMPRAEVEKLMGDDKAGGGFVDILFGRLQYLQARNPMREEHVKGIDGVGYDVLYYYTDMHARDNLITDDELTPIVFRDGKVAGIGDGFLRNRVSKVAKAP